MKGRLQFPELLVRYGKRDWVVPLEVLGHIANLAEDSPEHAVHIEVAEFGQPAARAFWAFLRGLPAKVGAASAEEFILGAAPIGPLDDSSAIALRNWDHWIQSLYQMALVKPPVKSGDGSSLKYREELLRLVYDEMDSWLVDRLGFWLKESGAKEQGRF